MVRTSRRQAIGWFGALAASGALPAAAQTAFPSKPIRIVVPHAPGGNSDTFGRILAQKMSDRLNLQVVVENKPGAGGTVGSALVSKSPPDGYSLVMADNGTHAIAPTLYGAKLSYDVFKDFTPITLAATFPTVIIIHPSVPAQNTREFVALAKSQPGKLTYSSAGTGNGSHLTVEMFRAAAGGLDMVHVPYKGGPEALQSVITGQTCCIFNLVQTVQAQWRAGKVRLLGVSTARRVVAVPDIPTIAESGVPGFESYIWFAFFGPKGLDPAIAARLNAATNKVLASPDIAKRITDLGSAPRIETVEQFRQTVKENRARWAEVVKQVGASID